MTNDKIKFGQEIDEVSFDKIVKASMLICDCLEINKVSPTIGYSALVNVIVHISRSENRPEQFYQLLEAMKKSYEAVE
jgi:hypothetical protein